MSKASVGLLFALGLLAALPVRAAMALGPGTCDAGTDGNYFSGEKQIYQPTYGVSATIALVTETLCQNTGNMGASFSSSWVGISAQDHPYDIYQVGFDRCQYAGCPAGTRWFWAYGTEGNAGVCNQVEPVPTWLGAPTGDKQYKIDRVFQNGGWTYAAYVAGSMVNWRYAGDLETCWTPYGPRAWGARNEVGDRGDQSGGEVSPHQAFSALRFKTTSGWVSANLIPSIGCSPVPDLSTQRCLHDGVAHDKIQTWDSRVP